MNELYIRNRRNRKILGGGRVTHFFHPTNRTLNYNYHNINQVRHQYKQPHVFIPNPIHHPPIIYNNVIRIPVLTPQQHHYYQMERLRVANMMNQEVHAIWPYGTFLSPMIPAPNVALPYAVPYATIPIYQSLPSGAPQQCTLSPVTSNSNPSPPGSQGQQMLQPQQSSNIRSNMSTNPPNGNQSNSNESNKVNIPCVSQSAPWPCASSQTAAADKDNRDTSSSLRSSPTLPSSDESTNTTNSIGAGGDSSNVHSPNAFNCYNGPVLLSQVKFNELTRLALRGSEIAEKVAYTHRNRPCFKKIDSLCARLKQDLIRPDGVLPNINSQGIAWAVKDFIFVFTRVINAWIIIKGYVYNTPEGLNKVKAALTPDFATSFSSWQDTTMDFVENLIKSFVNLDNLVQSQKSAFQKPDNGNGRNANTPQIKILKPVNAMRDGSIDLLQNAAEKSQQNTLNKNYLYTMVEDSEDSQRQATVNGTYFKTGTYNPIKKEKFLGPIGSNIPPTTSSTGTAVARTPPPPLFRANPQLQQYFDEQIPDIWPPTETETETTEGAVTATTATSEYFKIKEKISPNWLNYDLRVLEQNFNSIANDYDDIPSSGPPRILCKDLIDKLNIMIERLMSMKNADLFFKLQFTKNYFPDFIAKHKADFMDVRSIILKCQVGGYHHICEVVHDVKKIIFVGKEFLKINNDAKLHKSIIAFEAELNKLLSDPPFENYHFEHITGEPKEFFSTI